MVRSVMAVEPSAAMMEVGTQVEQAAASHILLQHGAANRGRRGGSAEEESGSVFGRRSASSPPRVNWVREMPSLRDTPKLKRK